MRSVVPPPGPGFTMLTLDEIVDRNAGGTNATRRFEPRYNVTSFVEPICTNEFGRNAPPRMSRMLESVFPVTALSEGAGLLYAGGEYTAARKLPGTSRPTARTRPSSNRVMESGTTRASGAKAGTAMI